MISATLVILLILCLVTIFAMILGALSIGKIAHIQQAIANTTENVNANAHDITQLKLPQTGQKCGSGSTCADRNWCNSKDNICYQSCTDYEKCQANAVPRMGTYWCNYEACR